MLKVLNGDCREVLKTLADESVHCVVTSPPYWQLRDYSTAKWEGGDPNCTHVKTNSLRRDSPGGFENSKSRGNQPNTESVKMYFKGVCNLCGAESTDKQIGQEETIEEYVETMVELFREVKRVLRKDGTVWLNLGDTYSAGKSGRTDYGSQNKTSTLGPKGIGLPNNTAPGPVIPRKPIKGLKPKNLCGIPWRVAFGLQADGWILRSDIIWSKPNALPESVNDRPTKSHEYLFLLAKSEDYYYDKEAIKEDAKWERWGDQTILKEQQGTASWMVNKTKEVLQAIGKKKNKRTVWSIPTQPYPGAHFAVFPEKLIEPCVLAGSPTQVCSNCGTGWKRILIPKNPIDETEPIIDAEDDEVETEIDEDIEVETVGWQPGCGCNKNGLTLLPGDFEIINTPVGKDGGTDPSQILGRAGFNRPRKEVEGFRPITRYEQRVYAKQLKQIKDPAVIAILREEAGTAYDHYTRTDKSGARPISEELLNRWVENGYLTRVEVPVLEPFETTQATVLDPFFGSGTTGRVALKHGRAALGIELNPEYLIQITNRTKQVQKVFELT